MSERTIQQPQILVLHGPNLNLLGRREPDVYGHTTLAEIDASLSAAAKDLGVEIETFQSNHEGELVDRIHASIAPDTRAAGPIGGILINPAGFTHSSVALRDALTAAAVPVVEVHLSNVYAREDFRQHSYISPIALGVISGLGPVGYQFGLEALAQKLLAS